jgi:hypothetical protein
LRQSRPYPSHKAVTLYDNVAVIYMARLNVYMARLNVAVPNRPANHVVRYTCDLCRFFD